MAQNALDLPPPDAWTLLRSRINGPRTTEVRIRLREAVVGLTLADGRVVSGVEGDTAWVPLATLEQLTYGQVVPEPDMDGRLIREGET